MVVSHDVSYVGVEYPSLTEGDAFLFRFIRGLQFHQYYMHHTPELCVRRHYLCNPVFGFGFDVSATIYVSCNR